MKRYYEIYFLSRLGENTVTEISVTWSIMAVEVDLFGLIPSITTSTHHVISLKFTFQFASISKSF